MHRRHVHLELAFADNGHARAPIIENLQRADSRVFAARVQHFGGEVAKIACKSFGSDWFFALLDRIQSICAAVTRQTLNGDHPNGWATPSGFQNKKFPSPMRCVVTH